MMELLQEPIEGITRDERMAEIEGESFDQLFGLLGE